MNTTGMTSLLLDYKFTEVGTDIVCNNCEDGEEVGEEEEGEEEVEIFGKILEGVFQLGDGTEMREMGEPRDDLSSSSSHPLTILIMIL